MPGRFSVNNLFEGLNQVVAKALTPVYAAIAKVASDTVKQIEKLLKNPLFAPVARILLYAAQISKIMESEIKGISKFIERQVSSLLRQVDKLLGKIPSKVTLGIKELLFRQIKFIEGSVRKILQDLERLKRLEATLLDPNKFVTKFERQFRLLIGKLFLEKKGLLQGFIDAGTPIVTKTLKKNKLAKVAIESSVVIAGPTVALVKNADSAVKLIKNFPAILKFIEPFLKAGGKTGKTLFKGLPILGDMWDAIDIELIQGQLTQIEKDISFLKSDVSGVQRTSQRLAENLKSTPQRIAEIEALLKTGKPLTTGNQSSLTNQDLARITQIVQNAIKLSPQLNTQGIATAVVNGIKPSLQPVNYAQIGTIVNSAVKSSQPTATINPTQLAQINESISSVKNSIPTAQQNAAATKTQIEPLIKPGSNVDLTVVASQLNGLKSQVTEVRTVVNQNQTGIGTVLEVARQINAKSAPVVDTTKLQQALVNSEFKLSTQMQQLINLDNANSARTQELIKNIRVSASLDANQINSIANATESKVQKTLLQPILNAGAAASNAAINANRASQLAEETKTEVKKLETKQEDTYKLVGGDSLKNGLPANLESQILSLGTQIYQGAQPVVNTLPALISAAQVATHFRSGLHRLPAQLPGSLTQTEVSPVTVADALSHQQQLFKLNDERFGVSTPIKTTSTTGSTLVRQSRNMAESLDTIEAQSESIDKEIEILQQLVFKLYSEVVKVNMIVLQDHAILESMRDFLGYRYSEEKKSVPGEASLGKESLLDWFTQSSLKYVSTKMDQTMDLTQMMQKLYLEIGKVSASTFRQFDPNDSTKKLIGEDFSKADKTKEDEEWLKFVKFVNELPSVLKTQTDPKPKLRRYRNNDTDDYNTSGVTLPTGQ